MTDLFYRAFEEKYRGPRSLISERLHVYLPFIRWLLQTYPGGQAIDLGCGRGEWLELLVKEGFNPTGVDLDEGMLEACKQLGLPAVKADALELLSQTESNSQLVVSAFHVVEHISFEQLRNLVSQAMRVLRPGGLLILETPNPENIAVSTRNFYLDPTHQRPIPPQLLAFIAEFEGFERVKTLRLQEPKDIASRETVGLTEVINCVSPDYAVIAQKKADAALMDKCQELFDADYGVSLEALMHKMDRRLARMESQSIQALKLAQQAEAKAQQAEVASNELLAQLQAVYASSSWKITRPLRGLKRLLARDFAVLGQLTAAAKQKTKRILKPLIVAGIRYVNRKHAFRSRLKSVIVRFPSVYRLLVKTSTWANIELDEKLDYSRGRKMRLKAAYSRVFSSRAVVPETLGLNSSSSFKENAWVRIVGHVEGNYSLAIVNRGLASALEVACSGKLQFVPYEGKAYSAIPQLRDEESRGISNALNRDIKDGSFPIISVVHHYPFIADSLPADIRLILFPWEETSVPSDVVEHINDHFDGVLVPSTSGKRALINSGCSAQIFVFPQGIDHLVGFDTEPISLSNIHSGQRIRFLHVSSVFERKGPDVLLQGYLEAFTSLDNVELYIKTFPNPHNRIREQLAELTRARRDAPLVTIDERSLESSDMRKLYQSSHAMVLPTRGEGFNLPAAEAMALGLPVIVTGGSAHADFCTEQTATLIGYSYSKSRSHLHASDACWLEPDPSDLANKLRSFRDQLMASDVSISEKINKGLVHVRNIYTWKNSAEGVLRASEWLLSHRNVGEQDKLRVALISPWSAKCGIAEYAKMIMASLMIDVDFEVDIFCDSRTQTSNNGAEIAWCLEDQGSVQDLIRRLRHEPYDVVIIQHHPGLIWLSDVTCQLLSDLQSGGAVVLLELHSTSPLIAEARVSNCAVGSLAKLDRIIVHQPDDLNNLLQLGLSDNVMILPHGVIQPIPKLDVLAVRKELSLPNDAIVLGSFGFAMPHKGIDVIIRCIKDLEKATNREVYFLSLNSIWDKKGGAYLDELKALAKSLQVDNRIVWVNDFLPIEESLRLLSCCNYTVFPYKYTEESASGAVTIGLATCRPVLVSHLEIFSDLSDVTYCIPEADELELVSAILRLENDKVGSDELIQRQMEWLAEREWGKISSRFANVVRSLARDRVLQADIMRVVL